MARISDLFNSFTPEQLAAAARGNNGNDVVRDGDVFGGNPIVRGGNPILNAAGIQEQALQDAIPFFMPFFNAGQSALSDFSQGSTVEGLDQTISKILSGEAFSGLVDERRDEINNQLSVGGLTRSGAAVEEAAAIPTELAFAIENLLAGRKGGLIDTGFAGASSIGDLTSRVGEAIASGILGLESQRVQRDVASDQNRSNLLGSVIGGVGSILGGSGGLASAFSDPRLKKNVEIMDKIGPLDLVSWDWIDEAKGTIIEHMPTTGFMADQVEEHFPHVVTENFGYKTIDYQMLTEELWHF